jgi:DNA-directed RNA polymerase specialized sigma24 family protein
MPRVEYDSVRGNRFLAARTYHWVDTVHTEEETPAGERLDLIAVERVVNNLEPLPVLTDAEKRRAVREMHRAGVTYSDMAARVGILERQVARWLASARNNALQEA